MRSAHLRSGVGYKYAYEHTMREFKNLSGNIKPKKAQCVVEKQRILFYQINHLISCCCAPVCGCRLTEPSTGKHVTALLRETSQNNQISDITKQASAHLTQTVVSCEDQTSGRAETNHRDGWGLTSLGVAQKACRTLGSLVNLNGN